MLSLVLQLGEIRWACLQRRARLPRQRLQSYILCGLGHVLPLECPRLSAYSIFPSHIRFQRTPRQELGALRVDCPSETPLQSHPNAKSTHTKRVGAQALKLFPAARSQPASTVLRYVDIAPNSLNPWGCFRHDLGNFAYRTELILPFAIKFTSFLDSRHRRRHSWSLLRSIVFRCCDPPRRSGRMALPTLRRQPPYDLRQFAADSPCIGGKPRLNLSGLYALRGQGRRQKFERKKQVPRPRRTIRGAKGALRSG